MASPTSNFSLSKLVQITAASCGVQENLKIFCTGKAGLFLVFDPTFEIKKNAR